MKLSFINMTIKIIFMSMTLHLASYWNRGFKLTRKWPIRSVWLPVDYFTYFFCKLTVMVSNDFCCGFNKRSFFSEALVIQRNYGLWEREFLSLWRMSSPGTWPKVLFSSEFRTQAFRRKLSLGCVRASHIFYLTYSLWTLINNFF